MRFNKLLIIYNPIAGRGRGYELAEQFRADLAQRGYDVRIVESNARYSRDEVKALLRSCHVLLVAGGDGTLQTLLPHLAEQQTPVMMLPAGNESLFAREFNMRADINSVEELLETGEVSPCYFGLAGDTPFFHMVSVGFDAEVVFQISRNRRGPIGHRGYIIPTFSTFCQHHAPTVTVQVDGETKIGSARGFLVVANTPAYAVRMKFVPEASSESPILYGRFFPLRSNIGFAALALQALLSRAGTWPGSTPLSGLQFTVSTSDLLPSPVQADGDFAGHTPLTISKAQHRVLVLRNKKK